MAESDPPTKRPAGKATKGKATKAQAEFARYKGQQPAAAGPQRPGRQSAQRL